MRPPVRLLSALLVDLSKNLGPCFSDGLLDRFLLSNPCQLSFVGPFSVGTLQQCRLLVLGLFALDIQPRSLLLYHPLLFLFGSA